PVEWAGQIEQLYEFGVRSFLEVGPGARLTGLVEACLSGREHDALAVDASAGKRSGFFDLACALAWLAARGHSADVEAWGPDAPLPEANGKRPKLTVSLTGANYVKPRPKRPAAPP